MRVAFVEWPEALTPDTAAWDDILGRVAASGADLLVTNELPFGPWIAGRPVFDAAAAQASIDAHLAGAWSLAKLGIPAVLSSRPVWAGGRLLNEAFVLHRDGIRPLHQKNHFPEEDGWWEATWFRNERRGFEAADLGGLKLGVLLCTDAMFNEHARHYGKQGASLIAIPRAAGTATDNWLTAGKMAAIVSGSYVVSSNRVGSSEGGVTFGGAGFAFAPDGTLLAVTDAREPLRVVDLDPAFSARRRLMYPCYV